MLGQNGSSTKTRFYFKECTRKATTSRWNPFDIGRKLLEKSLVSSQKTTHIKGWGKNSNLCKKKGQFLNYKAK